jgi:hypothetical protein
VLVCSDLVPPCFGPIVFVTTSTGKAWFAVDGLRRQPVKPGRTTSLGRGVPGRLSTTSVRIPARRPPVGNASPWPHEPEV